MRKGVPGSMGMSYELADAHVADMRASVWTLTRATFTGAAILLRDKAAYQQDIVPVEEGSAGCECARGGVGWQWRRAFRASAREQRRNVEMELETVWQMWNLLRRLQRALHN